MGLQYLNNNLGRVICQQDLMDVINARRLMEAEVINENTVTRSVPLTSCK